MLVVVASRTVTVVNDASRASASWEGHNDRHLVRVCTLRSAGGDCGRYIVVSSTGLNSAIAVVHGGV